MVGFECTWVVNLLRLHCVNFILKIFVVLNVLSSEYTKVLSVLGV